MLSEYKEDSTILFAASLADKLLLRNRPVSISKEKSRGYSVYFYPRIGSMERAFNFVSEITSYRTHDQIDLNPPHIKHLVLSPLQQSDTFC